MEKTTKLSLAAISHEQVAVLFLEWAHNKYWRTIKRLGGRWFEIGKGGNYTTSDLFEMFLKEMEEDLSAAELTAYYSQLEEESKNFGGL